MFKRPIKKSPPLIMEQTNNTQTTNVDLQPQLSWIRAIELLAEYEIELDEDFLTELRSVLTTHANPVNFVEGLAYFIHTPVLSSNNPDAHKNLLQVARIAQQFDIPSLLHSLKALSPDFVTQDILIILSEHSDPASLTEAIKYFSKTPVLKKENPESHSNFQRLAYITKRWFSPPSLLPNFLQFPAELMDNTFFNSLYKATMLETHQAFSKYQIAYGLCNYKYCLDNSDNDEGEKIYKQLRLLEKFVWHMGRSPKTFPSNLLSLPASLFYTKNPGLIAEALIELVKVPLFRGNTTDTYENLNNLILRALLWFGDDELAKKFIQLPKEQWNQPLINSLITISSNPSTSDATKQVLLACKLCEVTDEKQTRQAALAQQSSSALILSRLEPKRCLPKRIGLSSIQHDERVKEMNAYKQGQITLFNPVKTEIISASCKSRLRSKTEGDEMVLTYSTERTRSAEEFQPKSVLRGLCAFT